MIFWRMGSHFISKNHQKYKYLMKKNISIIIIMVVEAGLWYCSWVVEELFLTNLGFS